MLLHIHPSPTDSRDSSVSTYSNLNCFYWLLRACIISAHCSVMCFIVANPAVQVDAQWKECKLNDYEMKPEFCSYSYFNPWSSRRVPRLNCIRLLQ